MKRIAIISILFLVLTGSFSYAEENYKNGNGTLFYRDSSEEKNIEVRKFEIKNVEIGDGLDGKNTVYADYDKKDVKGIIKLYSETKMDIHEICSIKYIGKTNKWDEPLGELWLKISTKNISGWICLFDNWYLNYFADSNYEYLGKIKSGNKTWNIRKLNQWVSVWTDLNVRDKPGLSGKKIYTIKYEGPQLNYKVFEITEESETIDEKNERWIKIEYEKGKFGWVFGGYVSVERGGPLFETPEDQIRYLVGYMP